MLRVLLLVTIFASGPSGAGVARADVPDASLRAMKERGVRLEVMGAQPVEGRLVAFEAGTVTLVTATREVVSVPRGTIQKLLAVEEVAPAPTNEPRRMLGLQFSLLGTVAVDVDYGLFHGFASTSLLLPILTASGQSTYVAAALGGGVAIPLGKTSRWKLDAFATVLPLHVTSHYTYLGFGLGAGFHYTASSGFTFGFTMPVVGFSTRLGSSPHGYDPSFRYNDSVGYFYLAGLAGMPLVTMGYRFPAPGE